MSDTYDAAVEVRDTLCNMLPDEKERRRYALLQAAVQLVIAQKKDKSFVDAVDDAIWMLKEIEKREREGS